MESIVEELLLSSMSFLAGFGIRDLIYRWPRVKVAMRRMRAGDKVE